jgi:hypothetical protein
VPAPVPAGRADQEAVPGGGVERRQVDGRRGGREVDGRERYRDILEMRLAGGIGVHADVLHGGCLLSSLHQPAYHTPAIRRTAAEGFDSTMLPPRVDRPSGVARPRRVRTAGSPSRTSASGSRSRATSSSAADASSAAPWSGSAPCSCNSAQSRARAPHSGPWAAAPPVVGTSLPCALPGERCPDTRLPGQVQTGSVLKNSLCLASQPAAYAVLVNRYAEYPLE